MFRVLRIFAGEQQVSRDWTLLSPTTSDLFKGNPKLKIRCSYYHLVSSLYYLLKYHFLNISLRVKTRTILHISFDLSAKDWEMHSGYG
jgi:hypothetical protein